MATPSTNVLRPFAEKGDQKWSAKEADIRCRRVIDRALIECREALDAAMAGLGATPPALPDLAPLQKGVAELRSFARQLGITQEDIQQEVNAVGAEYVRAKVDARMAHPETGDTGKDVSRSVTNVYATAHAFANVVTRALQPYLAKKAPPKQQKDSDTAEINLDEHEPQEGDTGDATQIGQKDDDLDLGDFNDEDLNAWLGEPNDEAVILPMPEKQTPPTTPPAQRRKQ